MLGAQGLTLLDDPRVAVFQAQRELHANDDWSGFSDPALTAAWSTRVSASGYVDGSKDAALPLVLGPDAYTAIVTSASGADGIALAEVFDADDATAPGRLINISTRGSVGTGDEIMIAGFIVPPGRPAQVLIRGIGPGLAKFGVSGTLSDPRLEVFAGPTMIAANDDWDEIVSAAQTAELSFRSGAFPLASGAADAALLMYLEPGAYTVLLRGATNTVGTALIEVYLLE